jgi:hypothetical protein
MLSVLLKWRRNNSKLSKFVNSNCSLNRLNLSKFNKQILSKDLTTNTIFHELQKKGIIENKLTSFKSMIKKLKESNEILHFRSNLKKNEDLLLNPSIWIENSTVALKLSQEVINIKSKLKELNY